jgi:hypothetical protein
MDAALKAVTVPALRQQGFSGSMPHFRRVVDDEGRIDLLMFQYFSSGGSFVVEIARTSVEEMAEAYKATPVSKIKVSDVHPNARARLGSSDFPIGDHWFAYGKPNYEPGAEVVMPNDHYVGIAEQVVGLVESQAARYWAKRQSA